jgi:hypothetical protein
MEDVLSYDGYGSARWAKIDLLLSAPNHTTLWATGTRTVLETGGSLVSNTMRIAF